MSASDTEIATKIRETIATKVLDCPVADVTDSAVSNLDSIGRITLLVELENEFGVELTGQDYDAQIFSSLAKLADFVKAQQGASPDID